MAKRLICIFVLLNGLNFIYIVLCKINVVSRVLSCNSKFVPRKTSEK